MALNILRFLLILLIVAVSALYMIPFTEGVETVGVSSDFAWVLSLFTFFMITALAVIMIDTRTPRKNLSALSGVFLGLIAGLIVAYALSFVVDLVAILIGPQTTGNLLQGVKVLIGLITCYLGISLVMQTKDDFRFVIPYVEFAKEIRGSRPTLVDTSVIIDGRIVDLVQTRVIQGALVVPKFVLNELQTLADSSDKLKRARGRRGLDILQQLQDNHIIEVRLEDADSEGAGVDQKLISLAQLQQARIMTNDFNLNKVATLRGLEVINLNDLAKAMRPVALPGEPMNVKIIKPGESPTQGVGYLDDGTMIVVENARHLIDEQIEVQVTSTLQTSAGRMIFARHVGSPDPVDAPHDVEPLSPNTADNTGTADADNRPARRSAMRHPGRNPRRSH